jgi:hypothetical protein
MVALCFLRPVCGSGGPCLGHILSNQATFHWAGHIPSVRTCPIVFPFTLNRGRERVFRPNPLPFFIRCISLNREGRGKGELTYLFMNPEHNVEVRVIQRR